MRVFKPRKTNPFALQRHYPAYTFFHPLSLNFFLTLFFLTHITNIPSLVFSKKRENDTVEAEKNLKTKYTTWKQLPFCYFFYRMFSFGKCYSLCELHFTKAPSYLISPILHLAIVESCVLCFTYFHKISAANNKMVAQLMVKCLGGIPIVAYEASEFRINEIKSNRQHI